MDRITERDLALHGHWCNDPETGERLVRAGANLTGASLARADLTLANLVNANLTGANLTGARLIDASLFCTNLTGANLSHVSLACVALFGTILTDATLPDYDVPVVPQLHTKILAALEQPGNELDMGEWHTCETVHCWAGWIIVLAGSAGKALEEELWTSAAAGLIIIKSCPYLNGVVPNWDWSSESALAKIRAYAQLEAA